MAPKLVFDGLDVIGKPFGYVTKALKLNHRLRLALVSFTATGVVIACLFAAVIAFARKDVVVDKQAELTMAMRSFTPPGDDRFDLVEFHEAHPELAVSVFDADGKLVGSAGPFRVARRSGFAFHEGRLDYGFRFRGQDVTISRDMREPERGLDRLTTALAALWLPLSLLVGATTWFAAQAVFRPLQQLTLQALAMGGSSLSERLATSDRAEFGQFARGLNEMLDRIEETVRRGEQFSADAAHELRTPLAILRLQLETALLRERSGNEYQATIHDSLHEIDRVSAIVEALLLSARGTLPPVTPLDLEPVVQETTKRWRERFDERGVRLEAELAPAVASISCDECRVVLDNLLDNALRFAPERSAVTVRLGEEEGEVRLEVQDAGPGIPAELGDRIFDRFVRGDEGRNRASGGAGIGLAVSRSLVVARGGRMTLESRPGATQIGFCLPAGATRR